MQVRNADQADQEETGIEEDRVGDETETADRVEEIEEMIVVDQERAEEIPVGQDQETTGHNRIIKVRTHVTTKTYQI